MVVPGIEPESAGFAVFADSKQAFEGLMYGLKRKHNQSSKNHCETKKGKILYRFYTVICWLVFLYSLALQKLNINQAKCMIFDKSKSKKFLIESNGFRKTLEYLKRFVPFCCYYYILIIPGIIFSDNTMVSGHEYNKLWWCSRS